MICMRRDYFIPYCRNPSFPVDADKNTKQKVEEKDGVVIINEGDVEGDSGEVSITETDWDKIEDLKEYVPNLYIPGYVRRGMSFEKATVETYTNENYSCEYHFKNNRKRITIIHASQDESGSNTMFIDGYDKQDDSNLGVVYINDHQKQISGYLFARDSSIFVFWLIFQK